MTKKIISLLLAIVMILCTGVSAFAYADFEVDDNDHYSIHFNSDGKFRILHLSDIQDDYPLTPASKQFINEILAEYQPDLVVLGGDNTVASKEDKEAAIEELCNIFIDNDTLFTIVFGNHDDEQGYTREELWEMYEEYSYGYFVGFDATAADGSDLTGVGNHYIPLLSSDGDEIIYNLYMLDSNSYVKLNDGNTVYDCVHEDQIKWYKGVREALKAETGDYVPSMVFQHIICQEALDELYYSSNVSFASVNEHLGMDVDGKNYSFLPKYYKIQEGFLDEFTCCGYYNYGEADAMLEEGDVKAIFSGHDHVNDFTITLTSKEKNDDGEYNTLNLVNTAGETFHSYSKIYSRGARLIELDENNIDTYTTKRITVAETVLKEGSLISECEGGMSKSQAKLALVLRSVKETFNDILTLISQFMATFDIRPLVKDGSELVSKGYNSFKSDSAEMATNAGKLISSFFSSLLG